MSSGLKRSPNPNGAEALWQGALGRLRLPETGFGLFLLAGGFLALSVLTHGLAWADYDLPHYWVTLDPAHVPVDRQYLLGNVLYNLLGHAVSLHGALGSRSYLLFTGAITLAAITTLIVLSLKHFGPRQAAIFLGCLALTQLDYVLLHWMGKSDPIFIAIYAAVFFARFSFWGNAIGFFILSGVHPEQALVVGCVHFIMLLAEGSALRKNILGLALGLVAGAAGVALYKMAFMAPMMDRATWLAKGAGVDSTHSFDAFSKQFLLSLATVLWGGVLLLPRFVDNWRTGFLTAFALAICVGVAALLVDFTRDAVLLSLPVVFQLANRVASQPPEFRGRDRSVLLVLGVVALVGIELYGGEIRAARWDFLSILFPQAA